MKKLGLIIGLSILLLGSVAVVSYFTISNSEIELRNKGLEQKKVCEAYFDQMWKILAQKSSVTNEYKNAFKEIYPALIEGRYSQGDGALMKWIQESNPDFNVALYRDLMVSIEAERKGFFIEQKKLIDIDREHKTMRQVFPHILFIGGRPDLDIVIILSSQTKEIYKNGEENNISLF